MKQLIYIFIALLTLSACSNSHIVVTDNELPEEVFFLNDQIKPFSGVCVVYFSNTEKVKEEMRYKKGILDGEMISYFTDGSIKRKGNFTEGKMDGKWESWYEDGSQKYAVNYVDDTLNGDYVSWYTTGVIQEKGVYAENTKTGVWYEYDEAGMIIKKEKNN